jgi:signal transduction histidine kinase
LGGVVVQVPVPGVANGKIPSPKQAQEQLDILLSQARAEQNAELHQLLLNSGIAMLVMAVVSILLGWLVAGRVLRPLRVITSKAKVISSTNLHERIGLRGPDDEMRRLGDTFDALLERLERSFDAQRQFVANASHELRTPLARQRALLEVASADPQADVHSLRGASARAVVAGEEQEHLIEALLTLASSERGLDERVPFDLATISRTVVESKAPEATLRGIRIDADLAPAPSSGNERLARRLVANLVDNALHYNVEDGWVDIVTATEGDLAVLRISNSGPVIPSSDVERLFRPFERMARGRTARDGHGLGLSIVKAVTDAHGGTVMAVASPEGGLDVKVRLPVAPSPETALAVGMTDVLSPLRESSIPRR